MTDETFAKKIAWVGPTDGPFHWVLEQLSQLPIDFIPEGRIVGSDSILEFVDEGFRVLFALDGRCDPNTKLIQSVYQAFLDRQSPPKKARGGATTTLKAKVQGDASSSLPKVNKRAAKVPEAIETDAADIFDRSIGVVLGENWPGHRRTAPLPDFLLSMYWYETYDRLIPWLSSVNFSRIGKVEKSTKSSKKVSSWLDASSRLELSFSQERLNHTPVGLVVSDQFASRALWSDLLPEFGFQPVVCRAEGPLPLLNPDFVLLDLSTPPRRFLGANDCEQGLLGIASDLAETVKRVRRLFPEALLAVLDPFPRGYQWQQLSGLGCDFLLAKPFNFYGFVWCLMHWLESTRMVTIEHRNR